MFTVKEVITKLQNWLADNPNSAPLVYIDNDNIDLNFNDGIEDYRCYLEFYKANVINLRDEGIRIIKCVDCEEKEELLKELGFCGRRIKLGNNEIHSTFHTGGNILFKFYPFLGDKINFDNDLLKFGGLVIDFSNIINIKDINERDRMNNNDFLPF